MSLKFIAAALVAKIAFVGSIQTIVTRVGSTTEWTWDNDGWDMEGWVSVGGNKDYRFIPRPQLSGNPPNHLGIYTNNRNELGKAEHEPLKAVSPKFCNARSIEFALLSGTSDPQSRILSVHDIDEYKDYGDELSVELTSDLAGYSVVAEIEMPEVLPSRRSWLLNIGQATVYADHWLINSDGTTQFGPWAAGGQVRKDISSYLGQTITIITTYDLQTYNMYINGELFGSTEHENINLLSNSIFIGKQPSDLGESDFTGTINYVEMYNRVFSDDEIITGPTNVDDEGYLGLVLLNDDGVVVRHAERTEYSRSLANQEVFTWTFPADLAYECYTMELRDTKSGDWGHIGLEYAIVEHYDVQTPAPTGPFETTWDFNAEGSMMGWTSEGGSGEYRFGVEQTSDAEGVNYRMLGIPFKYVYNTHNTQWADFPYDEDLRNVEHAVPLSAVSPKFCNAKQVVAYMGGSGAISHDPEINFLGLLLRDEDGKIVWKAVNAFQRATGMEQEHVLWVPSANKQKCYTLELLNNRSGGYQGDSIGSVWLRSVHVEHFTPQPTSSPTSLAPTYSPTIVPTSSPTIVPTWSPTAAPTWAPSRSPTVQPSHAPTESEYPPLDFLEYGIICSINSDSKGSCRALGCKYRKNSGTCVALSVKKTKCKRVKDKDVCLRLGCKFGEDLTKSWNRKGCFGKPSNLLEN